MPPAFAPMPEPARNNRMMLLVFGTGAAIGLHVGLLHFLIWRRPSWLVLFVASSLLFSGVTWALWRWVFPRLGGGSPVRVVAVQTLVSFFAFVTFSVVFAELFAAFAGRPSLFGVAAVGQELHLVVTPQVRKLAILLPVVPSLLLTLLGYHQYWWRILALQSRERELQALAATAQREALRAQMNPHFLFNALNSIAQLIRVDPDRAEVCVERLAEMFRYVLRRAETELVPLSEELEMAAAYLEIERARFGERLQVETKVDADTLRRPIPNLVLQPLVENAVKHGLSRKVGVGTVRIEAKMVDRVLLLTVRDDGLGMAAPALAGVYERGIGLRNLRDRLERLYGADYRPEISSQPGRGTAIRLRLPDRPLEAAA
jgi:signal transduction histidine kinase